MTTQSDAGDYLISSKGHIQPVFWRRHRKLLRLLDAATDARAAVAIRRAQKAASLVPRQKVLLAAIEVPGRKADLVHVIACILGMTRHDVTVARTSMAPVGKFDNINFAISGYDFNKYDWILIIDDDIEVPGGFLDLFLYFAYTYNLKLAQPAHRFLSYASYEVTERHWASLARGTAFVEIGPVTLLHRDTFADLVPFPSLRWAWGLDMLWADVAKRRGWRIGIIDAVPIRHLRPIGASYDQAAACAEAIEFLALRGVTISEAEMFGPGHRIA